jgi:uncharacterized protein (TIGR04222 family)
MDFAALSGPEFLGVYLALLATATGVGVVLRRLARPPRGNPDVRFLHLRPVEAAYLAGGEEQAVDAAIASLAHRRLIEVHEGTRQLWGKEVAVPDGLDAMERDLFRMVGRMAVDIDDVRRRAAPATEPLRTRLEELGLLIDRKDAWKSKAVPVLLPVVVLIAGVVRFSAGVQAGRPVGFLFLLLVVTVVVIVGFLTGIPRRSERGDHALTSLKRRNAALQDTTAARPERVAPSDLALAVGLFGPGIIAAGPLAPLGRTLKPPKTQGASSTGGSCSSGGGGCGGGCGGGGCGGCGG